MSWLKRWICYHGAAPSMFKHSLKESQLLKCNMACYCMTVIVFLCIYCSLLNCMCMYLNVIKFLISFTHLSRTFYMGLIVRNPDFVVWEQQRRKWASTRKNPSSGFLKKWDSNQSPQLERLARKLKFLLKHA